MFLLLRLFLTKLNRPTILRVPIVADPCGMPVYFAAFLKQSSVDLYSSRPYRDDCLSSCVASKTAVEKGEGFGGDGEGNVPPSSPPLHFFANKCKTSGLRPATTNHSLNCNSIRFIAHLTSASFSIYDQRSGYRRK